MASQLWSVPADGGYTYSDELSEILRTQVQPATKFRGLCDARDGSKKGLHRGETYTWNVYSNVGRQGTRLVETSPIPETNVTITPKSLTVTEFGQAVPYTGKLEALGKHDIVEIIDNALMDDARKCFDIEAYTQMKLTPLRVQATSGTSTTSVTVEDDGVINITNDVAMSNDHIKAITDAMKERNIPGMRGDDYVGISHPSTWRPMKNDLEDISQYTSEGYNKIFNGEIGRYDSMRFIEQNHIPKGGAVDSTTFDPLTGTPDPWDNGKSSWAFFMGKDTVTEAIVIPEEIRAKIPGDFGRSKAIAWLN